MNFSVEIEGERNLFYSLIRLGPSNSVDRRQISREKKTSFYSYLSAQAFTEKKLKEVVRFGDICIT